MISRGAPAKFTAHKGSLENNYIIEKEKKETKRVSCCDCKYYCEDTSCSKEPIIVAEIGYNNWKKSYM